MSRPGGNPDLIKFQYGPVGKKPLDAHLGLKLDKREKEMLSHLPGWPNLLRAAISKIIEDNREIIEENMKKQQQQEKI